MNVFLPGKKQKDGGSSFTFPNVEAELSDELVKDYRLHAALRRVGRALARQNSRAIGVKITGLSFSWILDPDKKDCPSCHDGLVRNVQKDLLEKCGACRGNGWVKDLEVQR